MLLKDNDLIMSREGRVLVVDDNPTNRQILQVILKNAGYDVVSASSGTEVLATIDDLRPDVVLLDIMMPDIDGFEVCRRLKENPDFGDLPVLFISALDDFENRVKGLKMGAVDYISKPFNKDELLARVNTHLSIRVLTRQLHVKIEENESLVRTMSHDLSNLLQVNLGILELLTMFPGIEPKVRGYLGTMNDMSNQMKELIENIRGIVAIESGKREVVLEPVSLALILDNATRIFHDKMDKKGIRLVIDPDPIPPDFCILAEPISFQNSVINNIISNAIKFSYEHSEIRITVLMGEVETKIIFRDYGIGIEPGRIEEIFSSTKSTSTTGTRGEKGTGFGMPLVKRFVEKYCGRIELTSRHVDEYPDDHGTEITVFINTYKESGS